MTTLPKNVNACNESLLLRSRFIHMKCKCNETDGTVDVEIPFDLLERPYPSDTPKPAPCILILHFPSQGEFEGLKKCVDKWNDARLDDMYDGEEVSENHPFFLNAVAYKDREEINWLFQSGDGTLEYLLHDADPQLLVVHWDSKMRESIRPDGTEGWQRTPRTTGTTQEAMARSVFERRGISPNWVALDSLDRWTMQGTVGSGHTFVKRSNQLPVKKQIEKKKRTS